MRSFCLSLLTLFSLVGGCHKDCVMPPCPAGGFDFNTCRCTGLDGGLDATANGGFMTSVSGSKMLNTLSSTEKAQLCSDVTTFTFDTFAPDECRGYALQSTEYAATQNGTLSDSSLQSSCSSTYDLCVASTDGGGSTTPPSSDGATTSITVDAGNPCDALFATDCGATVAELSSCYSDLAEAFDAVPACKTLTRSELAVLVQDGGPLGGTGATPASCAAFEAKCPGFFSSSSSGSGSSGGGTDAASAGP
jgi:hypothetical protein